LQALDIRLSYNDVQLFLAIAKSIPQQTSAAMPDTAVSIAENPAHPSSSALVNETSSLTHENKEIPKRVLDPVLGTFLSDGVKPFCISKEGFWSVKLDYVLNTKDVDLHHVKPVIDLNYHRVILMILLKKN